MEYGNGARGDGAGGARGPGAAAAGTPMREQAEEYRDQALEFAQRAQEWIQDNPGVAILGAAAAGFVFARFVARRHR